MNETQELDFNGLVNRLAQEVAQVQRKLGAAKQKLTSTTRSLEIRTQELTEARTAHSLLLATLEASQDGILAVGYFGRTMHFNSRFVDIWDIPEDKASGLDDIALLALQMARVKDPAGFLDVKNEIQARPDDERCDLVELADGRMLECHVVPQRVRGRRLGSVTRFREVTERRPTRA